LDDSSNTLARVCAESSVSVPVLIHHDPEAHVLIMSDMGLLSNLASMFSELVGYIGTPYEQNSKASAQAGTDSKSREEVMSYYDAIGK